MRIEILFFDGCPNVKTARERVQRALELEDARADLNDIIIASIDDAQNLRFIGSPSIRINGVDIEVGAVGRSDYGFMCRTYVTGAGTEGSPSVETIRAAIRGVK